jgi:hypothetical protein
MSWKTEIQSLGEPWKTWLLQTQFYIAENNTGILVLEEDIAIFNSIELLSKAYGIAKKMHPQMGSLTIVSGDVYKLLDESIVDIHDIKINTKD